MKKMTVEESLKAIQTILKKELEDVKRRTKEIKEKEMTSNDEDRKGIC